MSETSYPVTVSVRRPDGSVEQVRVGTAVQVEEGFRLSLGELAIGAVADAPRPERRPAPAGGDGGMVFPPYGRSKGAPIAGGSMQDLEFYANGCRRTLNDPAKSRWHDKERVLLAAIEAEIAAQGGGVAPSFDDRSASRSFDSSSRSFDDRGPPRGDDDRGPPRGDDDIPF